MRLLLTLTFPLTFLLVFLAPLQSFINEWAQHGRYGSEDAENDSALLS
jgi:hypothetical protein